MTPAPWNRREVLKAVSAVALVGAHARPAAAQSVKWSSGTEAPKLKAPANATDCHHHIYNAKYPVDPKATLRPADALVDDYRALQKRIGTTRNVLVQPSTYGTDNSCHLDALVAFGPCIVRAPRPSSTHRRVAQWCCSPSLPGSPLRSLCAALGVAPIVTASCGVSEAEMKGIGPAVSAESSCQSC